MMDGFTVGAVLRDLAAQCAAFEALLLSASAAHKVVTWPHSRNVIREFAGVPAALTMPVLAGVVVAEATASMLMMNPAWRAAGALLASAIFATYLALVLLALRQGRRDVDCGCSFGPGRQRLGPYQVARNALLLCLSLSITAAAMFGSVPLQASHVLGALAFMALYAALDQTMVLRPLRGGVSR